MGLSLNLEKGLSLNLSKEFGKLNKINLGLGWDTKMDLDAFAILLDENNNELTTVFYANMSEMGVSLSGDNLTGEGDGDDETIYVDLNKLSPKVKRIALFANIYNSNGRTFNDVEGSFIRIINPENHQELAKYSLKEENRKYNAFHFADLIVEEDGLSFEVIGEGLNGSVNNIRDRYEKSNDSKKKGFFGRLFS